MPSLPQTPAREPLTALDWIAVVVALGGPLVLLALAPIGSTFAATYADFGSDVALPALTRFTTSIVGPAVLALPPVVALGLGLRARTIGARRAGVVLAFVLAAVGVVVCVIGDYLPLWQVAGAIRAD